MAREKLCHFPPKVSGIHGAQYRLPVSHMLAAQIELCRQKHVLGYFTVGVRATMANELSVRKYLTHFGPLQILICKTALFVL